MGLILLVLLLDSVTINFTLIFEICSVLAILGTGIAFFVNIKTSMAVMNTELTNQKSELNKLEGKLNASENRIEAKINDLEGKLESRHRELNEKIERLPSTISEIFKNLMHKD